MSGLNFHLPLDRRNMGVFVFYITCIIWCNLSAFVFQICIHTIIFYQTNMQLMVTFCLLLLQACIILRYVKFYCLARIPYG